MEQRVDHRSYEAQGIDREPMQHLGPVANDMEKNGKASRVGDENRQRQQRNAERAALAQEATRTSAELAQEKNRQDERVNAQKAALQSHILNDQIEMGRRHAAQSVSLEADLEERRGDRQRQLEAERLQLEQQLQADGFRKLMRDLLGKTRRDTEQLEITRKNLENIRMRDELERQALQSRQDAENAAQQQAKDQREADYAHRLEQERLAALEQAKKVDNPVPTREPANDRIRPSWTRSAAPEQDNQPSGAEDFKKAATPSNPYETDAPRRAADYQQQFNNNTNDGPKRER